MTVYGFHTLLVEFSFRQLHAIPKRVIGAAGFGGRPLSMEQRSRHSCFPGTVEGRGAIPAGKKGGLARWEPSYQWADSYLRLHTFAMVMGLMLVSLVGLNMGSELSAKAMMGDSSRDKTRRC